MKILAIGDPHGKLPNNLDKIVKRNNPDLIICVGDHGDTPKNPFLEKEWEKFRKQKRSIKRSTKEIFKKISSYKIPVLTLQGNMMRTTGMPVMRNLYSKYKNVYHKRIGKIKLLGQIFVLFDFFHEKHNIRGHKFTRKRFISNKKRELRLNKLLKENPDSFLISHSPPFGKVDEVRNQFTNFKKKHVGSKILTDAIKKYPVKYVFCGHIHEARGKARIGKTIVYNLGSHGDYIVIDTDKSKILESNFFK